MARPPRPVENTETYVKRMTKEFPKKGVLNAWYANGALHAFCKDKTIVSIPWERNGKNEEK